MSAEPSVEGGGVLPFPSAETITGSHSGSRPGSFEQPIQPARLPDAQTDATAHLPSGITDRTLRQKLYDNVWTAYWLEFIILIITLFVGAAAGALIGIFFFPSASPICSFSSVGDWGPWKECEPICGQKRTRSRNRTLFDLETIDDHKFCINAIETESCQPLMCCRDGYKGDARHCFNLVESVYTWSQARELAGQNGLAKLASIHNEQDKHLVDTKVLLTVWRLVACNERHGFVNVSLVVPKNRPKCSRSPDYCYEFQTKSPLSYYDAQKKNKLTIVRSWIQSEFLKTLMADEPADVKYWIGLRCVVDVNEVDGDQYSDWDHGCRWPDNSSIAFSNWTWEQVPRFDRGQTFCVLIDKEGGWHSESCDSWHPYIEEMEPLCDKVGQFIWSPWQDCPAKRQIVVESESNYTRYRRTNVMSNSATCPHFPSMSNDASVVVDNPTYQMQVNTGECWPYGGLWRDVRCRAMDYEYFDYCYQVGTNPSTADDTKYGAAMITRSFEAKYVIDMIKKSSGGTPSNLFRIGLRCFMSHLDYCYWNHNRIYQKLSYHMFADGHPKVTHSNMECVALRIREQDWVSVECDLTIPTLWEYKPYCLKITNWAFHDGSFGPPICDEETGKAVMKPLEKFNCPNNEEKSVPCPTSVIKNLTIVISWLLQTNKPSKLDVTLLEINSALELQFAFGLVLEHMNNVVETNLVTVFLTGMYHYNNAWRSASLGRRVADVQGLLPDVVTSPDQIHRLVIHAKKTNSFIVAELGYELWKDRYMKIRRQEMILERNATCDKFMKFSGSQYEWKHGDNCGRDWEISSTSDRFLNCASIWKYFSNCCQGAKTGAKLSACYKVASKRKLQTQAQVFPRKKILNGAVPDADAIDMWKQTKGFNNHEAFINVYCSRTNTTSNDWQCYGNGNKLNSDHIFAQKCNKLTSEMCVLVWNKKELVARNQDKKLKHYILQFQRFDKDEKKAVKNCGLEGVDLTRCPRD